MSKDAEYTVNATLNQDAADASLISLDGVKSERAEEHDRVANIEFEDFISLI